MLVVVEERAYEIPANAQGSQPVLLQNAPNPFNASTAISFLIPFRLAGEPTRLSIYNLTGQLVRVLQFETLQAGEHSLSWDGRDDLGREVASGVYIYRLDVGEWAVHQAHVTAALRSNRRSGKREKAPDAAGASGAFFGFRFGR